MANSLLSINDLPQIPDIPHHPKAIPNVIIVSRPDLFPKPMRAGGPLFTYKLLKIISILHASSGVKAKGGRTENDGAVYIRSYSC